MAPTVISLEVTTDHAVPVEPSLGGSVSVLNVSGDTLYYADNPQVSALNNQGTLTAGQSATFSPPQWLKSAGLSTVTVTVNDGATSSSGIGIPAVALTGTPTSGQVPTATGGAAATWQTPTGGTGSSLPSNDRDVTGNATAVSGDFIRADATGGSLTIAPPASPTVGNAFVVKKVDLSANTVSVSGTIDGNGGGVTLTAQNYGVLLVFVATDGWQIAGSFLPGGSGVSSVTAADGSVIVGGTASAPTIRAAVASVFGRTGAVAAASGDYNPRQIAGSSNGAVLSACCTNAPTVGENNIGDGTNIGGTTRAQVFAIQRGWGARLLFENFYAQSTNDIAAHQQVIVAAAIEDANGVVYEATFGGQHYSPPISRNGHLISDLIGIDFNAGDKLWLRTYYRLPSTTLNNPSLTLPSATITVTSTAATTGAQPVPGFDPNGGQFVVGGQTVTYTGLTATTFTGCTGGAGAITDGSVVTAKIPAMGSSSFAGEAAALSSTAPVDLSLGGTVTQAGGFTSLFMPAAVLASGPRQPTVFGVGDSIFAGLNDSGSRDHGALRRALIPGANPNSGATTATNSSPGVGHVLIATSQDKAATFAANSNRARKMRLAELCTHAVGNHSTNDLNATSTLQQVQGWLLVIAQAIAARNLPYYHCTCLPRTTSTDSWATTTNQTPLLSMGGATTLSSGLSTGAPITSLPVNATPSANLTASAVVVSDGNGNQQTFTLSGPTAAGVTSLPVTSLTPSFAFPSGSRVDSYRTALNQWMRSGFPIIPLTPTNLSAQISGSRTTLPVTAISAALPVGAVVIIEDGSTVQPWVLTAAAALNATTLTVASQTCTITYPTGTTVVGAVVPVGTPNAIVSGTAGNPFTGYFETADPAESARDSGLYIVNGSANFGTTDGTHPTPAIYTTVAAAIPRATFV